MINTEKKSALEIIQHENVISLMKRKIKLQNSFIYVWKRKTSQNDLIEICSWAHRIRNELLTEQIKWNRVNLAGKSRCNSVIQNERVWSDNKSQMWQEIWIQIKTWPKPITWLYFLYSTEFYNYCLTVLPPRSLNLYFKCKCMNIKRNFPLCHFFQIPPYLCCGIHKKILIFPAH